MDKMRSINSERMQYAREYYELSIADAASMTKIKPEVLASFEQGTDFPSYAQLTKIANAYNRNLLYFFLSEPPIEEYTVAQFRAAADVSNHSLSLKVKEMIEKADIYRMNLSDLHQEEVRVTFSDRMHQDSISTAVEFDKWLRKNLEFPVSKQKDFRNASEVIEYLRDKLYQVGVFVFKDSFKDNDVSGLCIYDASYPIVMINNKTSFNRQLFTIFHELYHILMKETDVFYDFDNEEKACDKFAGEFLIPTEDISIYVEQYRNVEDSKVISDIANLYNVSEDAVMYRLWKLNIISSDYYSSARRTFIRPSNGSSGGNFYYTKISYLGRTYLNNVFDRYYSGKLSIAQVGYMTQLRPANVSKLASNVFGGVF